MAVRYWNDEGHWTEWPCDLPAEPGLYKATDDLWGLDDAGALVQVITGIELVNPA